MLPNNDLYQEYLNLNIKTDFILWLATELTKARNHAHTQAYRDEIEKMTGLTPCIGADGVVVYTGQPLASEDGTEWYAGYVAGRISALSERE